MLIVEDGTRVQGAETYNSVVSANTVLSNLYRADELTAWTEADEAGQELALRRASMFLDSAWGGRFEGDRSSSVQAKEWPRHGLYYNYGVNSNVVPLVIQQAEASLALAMLRGEDPFSAATLVAGSSSPGIRSESVSIGPLSESTSYSTPLFSFTNSVNSSRFPMISALLGRLIRSGAMVRRG